MSRWSRVLVVALLGAPSTVAAQADSSRWEIRQGDQVIGEEVVRRTPTTIAGTLRITRGATPVRQQWSVVLAPEGTVPLAEVTVLEERSDPREKPRIVSRNRVIFKDDSVAVDAMTSNGLVTRLFATTPGAVPYLNLSFGMLEPAIGLARRAGGTASVPFFNLGGGQTVTGLVTREADDRWRLELGGVTFELHADAEGRLTGGGIPGQGLALERR